MDQFVLRPLAKLGEWYLRLLGVEGPLELDASRLSSDLADQVAKQGRASLQFCFEVIRMTRLLLHYGVFVLLVLLGVTITIRAML